MTRDIDRCLSLEHPVKDSVESCYWIARNYWNVLRGLVQVRGWASERDEIQFFRHTKPYFVRHIEYFSLLSEGLFMPTWVPMPDSLRSPENEAAWHRTWEKGWRAYWKQEGQRVQNFYRRHQAFLEYCSSDCSRLGRGILPGPA